jgi:hypothetical protein
MTSRVSEQAAELIRNAVDTGSEPDPLGHIRFAETLALHNYRRSRNRAIAVAAGTCVLAIGGFFTSAALQPKALTYRVDSATDPGTLGSYMSAPLQKPLGIQFSEGSRVVLQPRARGRVAQTTHYGATMVIEDGHAHADIVHRDSTDWRVLAGPFVVGVKGTSFDVAFDMATQTFELKMQTGTVRVTGPGLKEPLEVRDDQRLVLSARGDAGAAPTPDMVNSAALPPPSEAMPKANSSSEIPIDVPPAPEKETAALSRHGAPGSGQTTPHGPLGPNAEMDGESFGQLAASGHHRQIVELAEKQGLNRSLSSLNCSDLMALGNAARFAGRSELSSLAYRTLRSRFSGSSDAVAAAFFLGRLNESGSPNDAIAWYERYVAEAPAGVWVADALGRRMAILNQTSSGPTASAAAKEYLSRFPSGPYAGFARKILLP